MNGDEYRLKKIIYRDYWQWLVIYRQLSDSKGIHALGKHHRCQHNINELCPDFIADITFSNMQFISRQPPLILMNGVSKLLMKPKRIFNRRRNIEASGHRRPILSTMHQFVDDYHDDINITGDDDVNWKLSYLSSSEAPATAPYRLMLWMFTVTCINANDESRYRVDCRQRRYQW